jgi:hypothetical protein
LAFLLQWPYQQGAGEATLRPQQEPWEELETLHREVGDRATADESKETEWTAWCAASR